jgi:predicted RNA binding protein YcfA (HicA-like mRNA interferase family)
MKLPVVSGSEAVRAFRRVGYEFDEQHGSHMILRHAGTPHRRLSVPDHKELAKGTLRTLIREAGLTVEEFARDFFRTAGTACQWWELREGRVEVGQSIEGSRPKAARLAPHTGRIHSLHAWSATDDRAF